MNLHKQSKLSNFFTDQEGNMVVWQWPNLLLWSWIVSKLLGKLLESSSLHQGLSMLSAALLFTWAYLEITAGASPFRKVLGAVVMLALVLNFFR